MITFLMVFFIVCFPKELSSAKMSLLKDNSTVDVVGDVLVIRPMGLIELALNSLFFVISLPVTLPLKETKDTEEWLVKDTYNFCFNRRLGERISDFPFGFHDKR